LAATGGAVHFIAVRVDRQLGPEYRQQQLEKGLEEAARLAQEAGISASIELGSDRRSAANVLLPLSKRHDLLVLGTHGRSRAAGIMLFGTSSKAAHVTDRPLLIAREPPGQGRFPTHVIIASDGSLGSWAPMRIGARVAAAFNSKLEVLHVVEGTHPRRHRVIEDQIAEIGETTGEKPALSEPRGHAAHEIIKATESKAPSILICGRRGLSGIKALGSVSERVVHRAACSVLLVPPGDGPGTHWDVS
jgi:nucleotide-binding universal stress UspA family protein